MRARQANLSDLSDVALLKRLERKSKEWLYALCVRLFQDRELIITRTFFRTVRCGARGWRFTNEDFTFRDDAELAPALRAADYRLLTKIENHCAMLGVCLDVFLQFLQAAPEPRGDAGDGSRVVGWRREL